MAAAVPEVQASATGRPLAFASPSAKKLPQRSSMCELDRIPGSRASDSTSGVEREPGVIATLQENPSQLQRIARGFGWSLDNERVAVMHRSPNDVYIDEWVYELLRLIESTGARRVMIDSLSDLQYATPDAVRFREFVYSLTQRFSRAGISPIMTSEIPDLFHVGRLAEYGISHLSDNVVLLQYLRAESRLLRTVTILKSRASAHDPEIREFDITPDGIVLGDPITGGHA